MPVPLLDSSVLRNLLVNFIKAEHLYGAIDDVAVRNPKCN